jgi:2-haloacid dehalogenase
MAQPLPDQPRLITFDTYGTLIDWDGALRSYLRMLFGSDRDIAAFYQDWYYSHALPAVVSEPFKLYRDLLRDTMLAACAAHGLHMTSDQADRLGDVMADAPPFADTVPVLDQLRQHAPLATISNSQRDILASSARLMKQPFTYAFTGEVVGSYKPAPELFHAVLDAAGLEPHEVVHVAQSQFVDLPRSVPMGIATVWINRQAQTLCPEHPAPTAELPDLVGLPALLKLHTVAAEAH